MGWFPNVVRLPIAVHVFDCLRHFLRQGPVLVRLGVDRFKPNAIGNVQIFFASLPNVIEQHKMSDGQAPYCWQDANMFGNLHTFTFP